MRTILMATDFSEVADNAADYALELAKYFDATLILVNAYKIPIVDYHDTISVYQLQEIVKQHSESALEMLKKKLMRGNYGKLNIECCARQGNALEVAEQVAEEYGADLLVMGITGKAGLIKEHLIGSTTLQLARNLNMSTFIIPEKVKYHRVHKISFACDMDKTENTDQVYFAKYFSKIFDAELEIVNVENKETENPQKCETANFIRKTLSTVDHQTVTLHDKRPAKALERYLSRHKTDILMLSPKKHNFLKNIFHTSVSAKMAFHSQLPLLVIH